MKSLISNRRRRFPITAPLCLVTATLLGCNDARVSEDIPAAGTAHAAQPQADPEQVIPARSKPAPSKPPVPKDPVAKDPEQATARTEQTKLDEAVAKLEKSSKEGEDKHKKYPANRLAKETSPYLLMHAHNPVSWYPWGKEALDKAKKEKKLIFLSIGYSSCHWCHVMERKSFMNKGIADYLNKHFVCIKVDREERPEIDHIYMTSLHVYHQAVGVNRGGGWPLSMFLTPEAKPLLGGTYFPPDDFMSLLKRIQAPWTKNPESLLKAGDQMADFVRQTLKQRPGIPIKLEANLVRQTRASLSNSFDENNGGFGRNPQSPKFPEAAKLRFLHDRASRAKDEKARDMLVRSLDRMANGGIRDHMGGGFHRYTVDNRWQIPHFEKMLYDNGQLAAVYARAYQLTKNELYRRVVEELVAFVLREMTANNGGFFSALDADSEGEEGKFYVWTKDQLKEALDDEQFKLFADVYGVAGEANFEGKYVPLLRRSWEKTAKDNGLTGAQLAIKIAVLNTKLLAVRNKRERPLTDTKILTAWNGLMIRGLADAGRILKNKQYVETAAKAADFCLKELRNDKGRLFRTHTAGKAHLNAYVDDYAYLVDGLLGLHEATGEDRWLKAAAQLTDKQIELFWDKETEVFYTTSKDHEELFVRAHTPFDQARPSANSVTAINLIYLADKLKKDDYLKHAEKTITSVSPLLRRQPDSMATMAIALADLLEAKEGKDKP